MLQFSPNLCNKFLLCYYYYVITCDSLFAAKFLPTNQQRAIQSRVRPDQRFSQRPGNVQRMYINTVTVSKMCAGIPAMSARMCAGIPAMSARMCAGIPAMSARMCAGIPAMSARMCAGILAMSARMCAAFVWLCQHRSLLTTC